MRPLSETYPKPMLPVADRPLLAHTAEAAAEAGADELIVVDHDFDAVRSYFGEEFAGVPVTVVEQTQQAGTADAVNAAAGEIDGPFAVLNGDNLYEPESIRRLFEAGPSVGVIRVDEPSNYGVISTDDGTVSDIVEKPPDPPSNMANAGAYVFPERAVEWLDVPVSERGERELTDVLAEAAEQSDVTPVEFDRWLDVGRPWELLEANEWLLSRLERDVRGDVHPDAELDGAVVVEEGATVRSGVVIEGPTLVREGATVGPNAYVRGATLIGAGGKVGNGVELKNSVLMEDAAVPHLSYVGDSLLAPGVNLGAGTQVANLRHDDAPVEFTVKGDRVSTGRRKFGAVFGEGTKTSVNTSVAPGVKFSTNATSRPGESVTRDR